MDIAQAKQELRRTIRAYTAKTEDGVYRMPRRMQRPVLLMGPPGIGKTAIGCNIIGTDLNIISAMAIFHLRMIFL